MRDTQNFKIAIIGLGNLGLALSHVFAKNDHKQQKYQLVVAGRNIENSIKKLKSLDLEIEVVSSQQAIGVADLCLLTLRDSEIEEFCQLHSNEFKAGSILAHCSGTLDSEILCSAKSDSGVSICSIHPLNTFPTPKTAIRILDNPKHNTYLYAEGDRRALEICDPLFASLGFNSVKISREAKPLYHAACVFASNYLVSLIDASVATAEAAGIDRNKFISSIMPLANATLTNIEQVGNVSALSGPIARGDSETVAKHVELLSKLDSSLHANYVNLGRRALALARSKESLSEDSMQKLSDSLGESMHTDVE